MKRSQIIKSCENYVRDLLEHEGSGHDWWHIHRVRQMALNIAKEEGADPFICEMAALMHDLADEKLFESEEKGKERVYHWLLEHGVEQQDRDHILEIITSISFKGGNRPPMKTIEGKVVQDADRLDAIGAIGIARVFTYSGAKGQMIHDPDKMPREYLTYDEYRHGKSTAINHFYEKLLKLKELMNTRYGRKLAEYRHQFMEQFLEQFYLEWDGRK